MDIKELQTVINDLREEVSNSKKERNMELYNNLLQRYYDLNSMLLHVESLNNPHTPGGSCSCN